MNLYLMSFGVYESFVGYPTHAFIWWDSEPEKLSDEILMLLCQPETMRFVSVVSLWEIQIKNQLGKLELHKPLQEIYESQSQNGISFLSMTPVHIFYLSILPNHHKDPFDRMLISQAICEGSLIVVKMRLNQIKESSFSQMNAVRQF